MSTSVDETVSLILQGYACYSWLFRYRSALVTAAHGVQAFV